MDGAKKEGLGKALRADEGEAEFNQSTMTDTSRGDNTNNKNTLEGISDGFNEGGDFECSCRLEGLDEKQY